MRGFDRTNWLLDLINQRPVRSLSPALAASTLRFIIQKVPLNTKRAVGAGD